MNMEPVRFGVIGCGLMGREFASVSMRWLHLACELPRPVIVAACDLSPKNLDWFRQVPDTKYFYSDYHELLANPEVEAVYEFPFYPAVQQMVKWYREGAFGQIIEARFAIKHSSDMDLAKPINWKRMRAANGEYGCMGDLGIHTQHLPFRLGFSPRTVSAQLANIAKTRPDENGVPVPCETWDNAILMCEAQNTAGDTFPMQLEMKRMAPGCTNTVEYEIYGLNLSARFTTDDPNAIHYTQAVGREQAWARLVIGQKTLYPVITGSIFEFGFSDSLLQMFAAFVSELRGLPCSFGCFTPAEAHLSHRVLTAALESYTQKRVVTLE